MKRCLVVDDSSVIRKVARAILEGAGFEISEAENGHEALDRCKAQNPDVILLDWQLPVMGAMEFLSALRVAQGVKRPYIVYCTTENDSNDIARAFTAGADDYMLKPFDRETLVSKFADISRAA